MATNTEIYSNTKVTQVLDPATITADTNCTSVDTDGYESVMFLANIGESGDTLSGSVKIELEVEESDDNSTFTDVADADLVNYVSGTNDGCFGVIDDAAEDDAAYFTAYKGTKRYVRAVLNLTGTHTNGTPISVTALQAKPRVAPVNAATEA